MDDLTPEQAIYVVARNHLANAAQELEWADMPDIGEFDFEWLIDVLTELAPYPENFDEAITLLESRTETDET